jgi:hypothetical protein
MEHNKAPGSDGFPAWWIPDGVLSILLAWNQNWPDGFVYTTPCGRAAPV